MNTKQIEEAKARIQTSYDNACEEALKIVEYEARKVLRRHPRLTEFVMGYGGWAFRTNSYPGFVNACNGFKYLEPLHDFFEKWDGYLHLTGMSLRFTANGPMLGALSPWTLSSKSA